jgi:serine/threonine-protein kinase HipA
MDLPRFCTIEISLHGNWIPAAAVQTFAPDRCRLDYLPEYAFSAAPVPLSFGVPLGMAPDRFVEGPTGLEPDRRPPPFIYDLVPQGRGRSYLLQRLGLQDADDLILPLVMAGAFNPIGALRVDTAVTFFEQEARANPDPAATQGFELRDIARRSEAFLNHIALHAMLASGTTGVQGVAPKYLLATDRDGLWFADMALPDESAHEHWLLKLPRGRSDEDRKVLRNEAGYLRLAGACGLRVHKVPPRLQGEMLFVRRFDRCVEHSTVHRLQQESLASIAGLRGFGAIASQQELLHALRSVVDDPLAETIEFIKRDVLNLAMRNTDNHARNTAVQRLADGSVQLTPVFDFAPMFLDPELVVRSCHWRNAQGRRQDDWTEIIETLDLPDDDRAEIAAQLRAFAPVVAALGLLAHDCGVEAEVVDQCLDAIERQAEQLQRLPER